MIETLSGLAAGTLPRRPQDPSLATFAPALTPEDGLLSWNEPACALHHRIRGVSPKPGAFAEIAGRRVKVWASQTAPDPAEQAPPGTLLAFSKHPPGVLVAAGQGTALLLTEAQPDSGKRMSADAWARGLRLALGERFAFGEVLG